MKVINTLTAILFVILSLIPIIAFIILFLFVNDYSFIRGIIKWGKMLKEIPYSLYIIGISIFISQISLLISGIKLMIKKKRI